MLPDQFLACLDKLHWSQRGLASILNEHPTTVRRWATGEASIPPSIVHWLSVLARFVDRHPPPSVRPDNPEDDPAFRKTKAGQAYILHKHNAARRGIAFEMTFAEWWGWWQTDSRWANRGARAGKTVMRRKNDEGPYALWNVLPGTPYDNAMDRKPPRNAKRSRQSADPPV